MNGFRLFLWVVGGALVVGGLVYAYNNTTLTTEVPYPIAIAGLAVLVGLMFMGFADRVGRRKTVVVERVVDPEAATVTADDSTIVRRTRPSRAQRIAARRAEQRTAMAVQNDARYATPTPVMAPAEVAGPTTNPWAESHVHQERTVHAGPDGREVKTETIAWHRKPSTTPAQASGASTGEFTDETSRLTRTSAKQERDWEVP